MEIEKFTNFLNENNIFKTHELCSVVKLAQVKESGKKLYYFEDGKLVEKRFQNTNSFNRFDDRLYYLLTEKSANTFNSLRDSISEVIRHIDYVFKGVIELHCQGKSEEAQQYLNILYGLITMNKEIKK